jgi:DNA-binding transcriptional ArsR family regulator
MEFLRQKKEAPVTQVSQELKLSLKATSKHLALLSSAGFLDKEQRSTNMFFSISNSIPEFIMSLIRAKGSVR